MKHSKTDLLLHPIRIRLMTELGGRQMTAGQLAQALPDIPQASLYRHIKLLLNAGILEIIQEQMVNGSIERTLAIAKNQDRLTDTDDHLQYFNIFTASLIDTFARYIKKENKNTDLLASGLSYNRALIYLTDEERAAFQQTIVAVVQQAMANEPTPERKRFTLASIVIPDERNVT